MNNYQAVPTGILTDWGGNHISRKILNQLRIGNIVRIHVSAPNSPWKQTMYIRIIKVCGYRKYRGIVEDPYWNRSSDDGILFENGEIRTFTHSHVCEIPLDWKGNINLIKSREARKSKI